MSGACERDLTEIEEHPSMAPEDLEFCDGMLRRVSRTFAPSIQGLPPQLRDPVCIAYLLCRVVDTVEDDRKLARPARVALFAAFDRALVSAAAGRAEAPGPFETLAQEIRVGDDDANRELCAKSSVLFRAFAALPAAQRRVIVPRVIEMSSGMFAYCERVEIDGGLRLRDVDDLERYCYHVAGTVGEFLTDLFLLECSVEPARKVELLARATRFGTGLQLVNILKDIAEDAQRGDCFLPSECAREFGVDFLQLFTAEGRPRGLSLVRALARRAREHLAAAEQYTLLWPLSETGREIRLFCAAPLALALGTLQEIELGEDSLLHDRAPTVTRSFVGQVFREIYAAMACDEQAESDLRLSLLFDRARVGLAGRPPRPALPSDADGEAHALATSGPARQERALLHAQQQKRPVEARP